MRALLFDNISSHPGEVEVRQLFETFLSRILSSCVHQKVAPCPLRHVSLSFARLFQTVSFICTISTPTLYFFFVVVVAAVLPFLTCRGQHSRVILPTICLVDLLYDPSLRLLWPPFVSQFCCMPHPWDYFAHNLCSSLALCPTLGVILPTICVAVLLYAPSLGLFCPPFVQQSCYMPHPWGYFAHHLCSSLAIFPIRGVILSTICVAFLLYAPSLGLFCPPFVEQSCYVPHPWGYFVHHLCSSLSIFPNPWGYFAHHLCISLV